MSSHGIGSFFYQRLNIVVYATPGSSSKLDQPPYASPKRSPPAGPHKTLYLKIMSLINRLKLISFLLKSPERFRIYGVTSYSATTHWPVSHEADDFCRTAAHVLQPRYWRGFDSRGNAI